MNHEIQILVDYVEGKLEIREFRYQFLNNIAIKKLLESKIFIEGYKWCNYNIYDYITRQINPNKNNWDNIYSRYVLWIQIVEFLKYFKIPFNDCYNRYREQYLYLLDIQPSWLDIVDDQGIFDKIIAECPKDLSKTKRIAWGKARIKELFKYDKTYPRWIQDPEWPIINGKPLVFSHQKKAGKDDERVYYYFYDPDTKEETIITQMH